MDDNANLSHENPGPEETCDVGAIEKLAYDLWLARLCPVGCPEVDWFAFDVAPARCEPALAPVIAKLARWYHARDVRD